MQGYAARLNKLSGQFFLVGLITSKMKSIPFILFAPILNLVSLIAYLIGYLAWLLATLFSPDIPGKKDAWYNQLSIKEQYQISAILGTIATVICLTLPSLIIYAVWIYTVSNLIWGISEYHKIQNPPQDDPHYSSNRQSTYLRYVLLIITISSITALACTIALSLPELAFASLMFTTIVGNALTLVSLYYLNKCASHEYEPDAIKPTYARISEQLPTAPANTVENAPVQAQSRPIIQQKPAIIEVLSDDEDFSPLQPCL